MTARQIITLDSYDAENFAIIATSDDWMDLLSPLDEWEGLEAKDEILFLVDECLN